MNIKILMSGSLAADIVAREDVDTLEDWLVTLPAYWLQPVFHIGQASLSIHRFLGKTMFEKTTPTNRLRHQQTQLLLTELQLVTAMRLMLRGHDYTQGNDADEQRVADEVGGRNVATANELLSDVVYGIERHLKQGSSLVAVMANLYTAIWRIRQELAFVNDRLAKEVQHD